MSLPKAASLLSSDLPGALEQLMFAWRISPNPRVAEVIDRVSDEITASKPALAAKTVEKQIAEVLALHATKSLGEFGRIATMKWPGTWQKALPLLLPLIGWPDDPRLERVLVQLLIDPPWDSQASWGFFSRVFPRLNNARDVRIAPLITQANERPHPYWYRRFVPDLEVTRTRLETTPPPKLSAADEAALAVVEARYAGATKQKTAKVAEEGELLQQILARPDDQHARVVFADWLTEKNDPRGELLTLQLNPTPTRPQTARINALIKKHGSTWAGSLDSWFKEHDRQWEGGFLTGGVLVDRQPGSLDQAYAADPLWKLIRVFEGHRVLPPAALVAQLEELHGLDEAQLEVLGQGAALPRLKRLSVEMNRDPNVLDAKWPSLSAVDTLGIDAWEPGWLGEFAFLKQVKHLLVRAYNGNQALAGAQAVPTLRSVSLEGRKTPWIGAHRTTFSRTKPGPFTEVMCTSTDPHTLSWVLRTIDPAKLTRLELRSSRAVSLTSEQLALAEQDLAKLTAATHIEVPWERPEGGAKPVVKKRKPDGARVRLMLSGTGLLEPDMSRAWKTLGEGGFQFDSYRVSYGSVHRKLGKKPLELISRWGANAKCSMLTLYNDGGGDELTMHRPKRGEGSFSIEFDWAARDDDGFRTWLTQVLDGWPALTSGVLNTHDGLREDRVEFLEHGRLTGSLMIFSEHERTFFPKKPLQKALAPFEGAAAHFTARHLLLTLMPSLDRFDGKRAKAIDLALREVLVNEFNRQHGIDFARLVTTAFGRVVKTLKLEQREEADAHHFTWERGKVELVVSIRNRLSKPRLAADFYFDTGKGRYVLTLVNEPFDAKALPELLTRASAKLAAESAAFIEKHSQPKA